MFYRQNNRKRFFVQAMVVLITAMFLLTGCLEDEGNDTAPTITGYWVSSYDGFEVTSDGIFKYYYDTAKNVAFQGSIEAESSELDDTDGKLVIHLTDDGVYIADYNGYALDYTYMVDGYYTIVPWKNLGDTTCDMTTPYKDGTSESQAAKQDAITSITVANGYFTYYGTYIRQ